MRECSRVPGAGARSFNSPFATRESRISEALFRGGAVAQLHRYPKEKQCMTGYHADWVGAVVAGVVAAIVFSTRRIAFPRLTGVGLYLVLGLAIAVVSLFVRELLRHFGIR
jgi:hypothetical protein